MNSIYKIDKERKRSEATLVALKTTKKERYEGLKLQVKKLEENNFSSLLIFESGDDWYKMGGNSLLIYNFLILRAKLNQKPNIQPDSDYTKTTFEEGIISLRGTEALEKKLKKAKVFLEKKKEGEGIIRFSLNFSSSKAEVSKLRAELRREQEKTLEILKPKTEVAPETYAKIRQVQRRVFDLTRKMSIYERDYNGMLMAEYSRKMAKYYLMLNSGMIAEREGWKTIAELAQLLKFELSFSQELKVINREKAVSIGGKLVEIRREAEERIKRK